MKPSFLDFTNPFIRFISFIVSLPYGCSMNKSNAELPVERQSRIGFCAILNLYRDKIIKKIREYQISLIYICVKKATVLDIAKKSKSYPPQFI